ncbi:unnamed protein product [Diamesa hyperborea]
MESNEKYQLKLAPLQDVNVSSRPLKSALKKSSEQRLNGGCTTLMYACQHGHTETIIKELRSQTSAIQKRDRSNKNTLHYCVGQKSLLPAASIAMTAPELMEAADEDGFTPLHLAVIQGNVAVVNLLLANKADVNALDNEGHSVVHWATVCGEVDALRSILSSGANVSTPDVNGGSPLHYAAQMCGANYEGKSDKASVKLALDILNILLKHPQSSVDVEDKDGRQPLLWAASAGSAKALLALIKAGAYVEASDKDGLTALHCAASRGHTECIDSLIKLCGAHTDLIDSNGCTALHYAVTLGHADASSLLLDLEADPDRQDRKGRTPAHCACAKGQFETVKILGGRGANLWLRNARGDLPVHEAATSGRRELVQWLLEQKPNHINTTSNDGRTLLHIAAGNDNTDMCKMLIDLGADVNSIYRNAKNVVKTPLDCALQKGFRSTAKFVQMHGGLPANKLRLSGRKSHNILPELDEVKPLKFAEKEITYDTKERPSKRSDSESDSDGSRRRHKKRKCHHKRRTSSCSETFICHRVDNSCDLSRSKSSNELHRRRKSSSKQHSMSSTSSSASSQSDSSDEECCYHTKRKHRCYKKEKSKSRDRDASKKRKGSDKKGSESSECKENNGQDKDQQRNGNKRDKRKVEIASGSKRNDGKNNHPTTPTSSAGGGKGKVDLKITKPVSAPLKKRPASAKPVTALQKKPSQDDKSKVPEKMAKSPDLSTEHSIDNSKKSTPTPTTTEDVSEEDKGVKEIITHAEVHKSYQDNLQTDVDDGALTDATYTVDKREKSDFLVMEPNIKETAEEEVLNVELMAAEASKKVSFKSDAEIKTPEPPKVQPKEPLIVTEKVEAQHVQQLEVAAPAAVQDFNQELSLLSPSPPDDSLENIPRPKSQTPESVGSFTVLDDGDDADEKLKEFEEMTQDESYQMLDNEGDDSEQPFFDDSSSLDKPKKRAKKRDKFDNEEGFKVLDEQSSKDHDSGFEPSPRAVRTKIPLPRSSYANSTATTPRKASNITDERPKSTRAEGRKPGDKNAVNMTTVTQSIQKNIRRYYMERKIFQHLLELKSLQIRSSKSNEAVLVKRAVDDYHKSVNDLGFEVGGTLNKYQLREYTFKNFELFLYETLKSLQKPGTFNFQNISEVYREAERRLSPDFSRCDKALYCTTKTHRCLHAAHAYTGIPCAAYIPMMNHHTMPKFGYGSYKTSGVGTFYLPKILTNSRGCHSKMSLEFSHGSNKKIIPLPSDKLDSNKRYYVTFTLKDNEQNNNNTSNTNNNNNLNDVKDLLQNGNDEQSKE